MLDTLHDNLVGEVVDYLDMHSIGALATTLGHRVKDIYTIRCRSCGGTFINKLGKNRRMRHPMLRCNAYRCRGCTRRLLSNLTVGSRFHISPYYFPSGSVGLLYITGVDEDDAHGDVGPLEVYGSVLRVDQPEVERLEA